MNDMDDNKEFGRRIKAIRTTLGISQEELAFKCELNRTYMGALERGEKTPSLNTILKLCKGLHISVSDFFKDWK